MGETQASVAGWLDATFPGTNPDSPRRSLRALEEMVELCLVSGATYDEIGDTVSRLIERDAVRRDLEMFHAGEVWSGAAPEPQPDKIPAEAADVLIVLYGVAGMRGFDLHAEVDRKMAINRGRQWEARGDGTGYHVEG
jgi:hypothetical protein